MRNSIKNLFNSKHPRHKILDVSHCLKINFIFGKIKMTFKESFESLMNGIASLKDQLSNINKSEGGNMDEKEKEMAKIKMKKDLDESKAELAKATEKVVASEKALADYDKGAPSVDSGITSKIVESKEGAKAEVVAVETTPSVVVASAEVVPVVAPIVEPIVEPVVAAVIAPVVESVAPPVVEISSVAEIKEAVSTLKGEAALKFKPDSESCSSLSDPEKSLASENSYIDLIKMVCSLANKIEVFEKDKKKSEANVLTESRFSELSNLGLAATASEKIISQKNRLENMNDTAFASYKEELLEIKASVESNSGKSELEQARASAGLLSVAPDLNLVNLVNKYMAIK